MSILSQLVDKKITWTTAIQETGQWFQKLGASAPPQVLADLGQAESSLKQGLSNAIALGDTALGPLLTNAAGPIEVAVTGFLDAVSHGVNLPFSPAEDAGISLGIQALHTLIDELATQARSKLGTTTPTAQVQEQTADSQP